MLTKTTWAAGAAAMLLAAAPGLAQTTPGATTDVPQTGTQQGQTRIQTETYRQQEQIQTQGQTGIAGGQAATGLTGLQTGQQQIDPILRTFRLADLIGQDVYGTDGENIGEIENLVAREGELYAVFDADQMFDPEDRDFVVPLTALQIIGDNVTLPLTEAQVSELQEFETGIYDPVTGYETLGEAYQGTVGVAPGTTAPGTGIGGGGTGTTAPGMAPGTGTGMTPGVAPGAPGTAVPR